MKTEQQYTNFIKGKKIRAEKALKESEVILENIDFYYSKYKKKYQKNNERKINVETPRKEEEYLDDLL
ncbi:hypothetical protein ABMA75_03200 [Halobacteriovorax sp. ZH4_bin.1]|uniref:hypothetical protein n=1 Tax=unclassified Halobacteriovorax TaxID=2639665 RepID=UPI0037124067